MWDLSLIVFQHAQDYTKVAKAVIGKHSGRMMFAHLQRHLAHVLREALERQWPTHSDIPLNVVVHHLASSLVALLSWWIDQDVPDAPERMNHIFQQLTQPAIETIRAKQP